MTAEKKKKKAFRGKKVTCLGQKQTGDGEARAGICRRVARAVLTLTLPRAQPCLLLDHHLLFCCAFLCTKCAKCNFGKL